jgi:hypothetical protein
MDLRPDSLLALEVVLGLPVKPGARLVAIALFMTCLKAHRTTNLGCARSTLMKMTGLSKDGVDGALKELVGAKLIKVMNPQATCFDRTKVRRHTHRYDVRPLVVLFESLLPPQPVTGGWAAPVHHTTPEWAERPEEATHE